MAKRNGAGRRGHGDGSCTTSIVSGQRRHCSILDACGLFADGDYAEILPLAASRFVNVTVNGRAVDFVPSIRIVWGQWNGMKVPAP